MIATATGQVITRESSAVAKAARIVDVAQHADDAGAAVCSVRCASFIGDDGADTVEIQTDGAGFLALVPHFELIVETDGRNVYGTAKVGPFDQPVHVFAGLADTLAAGLVAS